MNYLFALLFITLTYNPTIEVNIVDVDTNETLVGVSVNVNDKTYYTDFDGNVTIPKSKDSINISYISYDNVKVKINNSYSISLKSN